MRITVIGGTGLVGGKLVAALRQQGHDAVAAARSTGVDTFTGDGLARALDGASVVMDVSNTAYADAGDMRAFFERSGANLVAAARAAGVVHHVILSAIGTDRFGSGYFRAKAAQEEIVAGAGLPFTIVRSAPFFEFIYMIVDAGGTGSDIRLPPVLMQPVAAGDVATALSQVALQAPANAVAEIVGPDRHWLPVLAEEILTANEDGRRVIVDTDAPYFGARIGEAPLTAGADPRVAPTRFDDWLRQSLVPVRCGGPSPELAPPRANDRETANA